MSRSEKYLSPEKKLCEKCKIEAYRPYQLIICLDETRFNSFFIM